MEPEEEGGDDWAVFRAVPQGAGPFSALGWRTRGFATRCVGRLLELSQNAGPAHFNITLAQELRQVQTEGETDRQTDGPTHSLTHSLTYSLTHSHSVLLRVVSGFGDIYRCIYIYIDGCIHLYRCK